MPTLSTAFLIAFFAFATAYPNGAPLDSCKDLWPRHGSWLQEQPEDTFPYDIEAVQISEGESSDSWEISLTGATDEEYFRGLILQVRSENITLGKFQLRPDDVGLRVLSCSKDSDTVTHSNAVDKSGFNVIWTRSGPEFDNFPYDSLEIVITVVKEFEVFWVDLRVPFDSMEVEDEEEDGYHEEL